jgi:multidrug efflux pump subunit AcrA (membrane-fusion protein)
VFPNKHTGTGDYDLIPGQYAPVRLILGENPDALLIPETALVETQAGTNVFVVGKDNKVESRKVVAGSSYKQQRVINDGLKHGEQVIIEGVQKVRPGMAVKPKAASSPKS